MQFDIIKLENGKGDMKYGNIIYLFDTFFIFGGDDSI